MIKNYMTLCFLGNDIDITHEVVNGSIEVTATQNQDDGQTYKLVTDLNGNIISNTGFNESMTKFLRDFVARNAPVIEMESRGEI